MSTKIFTIFDSKVGCYFTPVFGQNRAAMIRSFGDLANDKSHHVGQHPEDYTLFELGSYSEDDASFDLHSTPVSLGVAIEFVKQREQEVESKLLHTKIVRDPGK